MSQLLLVNNFEGIKDTSEFNEGFIKNYNEVRDEGFFREADVQYPENLHNLHNGLPFLPERIKIEKVEKLVVNLQDETEEIYTHKKFKTDIKSWISFLKRP